MTGVVLGLVNEAIDILHKLLEKEFRNGNARSGHAEEWVALLGALRAVDAILKHESAKVSDVTENDAQQQNEVKKVERRLRLWSRKPDQVNSSILATFLHLCHEEKTNRIKVERLRDAYVQQRGSHTKCSDRSFNQNFWLMTSMGSTNHGKVFDVDESNNVVVWHRVEPAVERFREEMTCRW